MKQRLLLVTVLFLLSVSAKAFGLIDTGKVVSTPLEVSGSVDTYYKYDLAGNKISSIPTSFATEQNSISIGMIDVGLKKKVDKASFVGELSFGPRSDQSIGGGTNTNYHIQNLYVGYDFTDKFNITMGYMATFLGYEVNQPTGNFNYSTSYIFTNSPFQNAGIRATYSFNDNLSLMAGLFNDYSNLYQSVNDVSTFGAQLMVKPVKGWTAYLNLLTGYASGTELDLTTSYQITNLFKLGLNGATFTAPTYLKTNGGFSGIALYPQYTVSKNVILGLRGEYFATRNGSFQSSSTPDPGQSVTAFTLTANLKAGPLTFIPEIRLDNGSGEMFLNSHSGLTKTASQFVFAAVYAF